MAAVQTLPLAFSGFRASASCEGKTLTVVLLGTADMAHASALAAYMPNIHADAARLGVEETIVDFRELEFMSSACFKALVTWLVKIDEMPAPRRYRVRFRREPKKQWQMRSLSALKSFAVDTVTIDP